jgi:hypothetical protein
MQANQQAMQDAIRASQAASDHDPADDQKFKRLLAKLFAYSYEKYPG